MSSVSLAERSAGASSKTIATHRNPWLFLMTPPFAEGVWRGRLPMDCILIWKRRLRPFFTRKQLPEQKLREFDEVAPPHKPRVLARRFNVHVANVFRGEPCPQRAVEPDQIVAGSAGDPEQSQLRISAGIQLWEIFPGIAPDARRTECADPGKFVQVIQTRQQ